MFKLGIFSSSNFADKNLFLEKMGKIKAPLTEILTCGDNSAEYVFDYCKDNKLKWTQVFCGEKMSDRMRCVIKESDGIFVFQNERSDGIEIFENICKGEDKKFASFQSGIVIESFMPFYSSRSFLSNFHESPMEYKGIKFENVEQMFQYFKAKIFKDEDSQQKILDCKSPKEARDLGQRVQNYDDNIWKEKRVAAMEFCCKTKFFQNENLKQKLLETGSKTLVEASPIDTFWGIGWKASDPNCFDRSKWRGENMLGQILTEIRDGIKNSQN